MNKKYFLASFIFLLIQFLMGISFANAICDNEIKIQCSENMKLPPGGRNKFCDEGKHEEIRYWVNYFLEDRKNFSSPQAQIKDRQLTNEDSYNRVSITYKSYTKAGNDVLMCLLNHALGNSSSSSSSQSNEKSNQQSANNQSSSSSSESPNSSSQQNKSTSNDSRNGLNMKPQQAGLVNEASQTYETKTAAFEESHKGIKRTHNKGDEASRCLKMDGRQIANTCDFRVEYIFCAYNPDQKAFKAAFEMAAAFDCEKRQMGMQGAAPRKKQAGTFTSDAVYIFACKDPSLPAGVTYERGRGLSGRCE